jgi:hypothetical protein
MASVHTAAATEIIGARVTDTLSQNTNAVLIASVPAASSVSPIKLPPLSHRSTADR